MHVRNMPLVIIHQFAGEKNTQEIIQQKMVDYKDVYPGKINSCCMRCVIIYEGYILHDIMCLYGCIFVYVLLVIISHL